MNSQLAQSPSPLWAPGAQQFRHTMESSLEHNVHPLPRSCLSCCKQLRPAARGAFGWHRLKVNTQESSSREGVWHGQVHRRCTPTHRGLNPGSIRCWNWVTLGEFFCLWSSVNPICKLIRIIVPTVCLLEGWNGPKQTEHLAQFLARTEYAVTGNCCYLGHCHQWGHLLWEWTGLLFMLEEPVTI